MQEDFYARSANGEGERETVTHHLCRVGELCGEFAESFHMRKAGEILGRLHDLGKYSQGFQEVLSHRKIHVNHAVPGAAVALGRYRGHRETAKLLALLIAAHHSELDSGVFPLLNRVLAGEGEPFDEAHNEIPLFGHTALIDAYDKLQLAVPLPQGYPEHVSSESAEDANLAYMLGARMLFSALTDADYSASAEHFDSEYLMEHTAPKLDPDAALDRLYALREQKQKNAEGDSKLNKIRDRLFDDCLEAAMQPPGLFTLTAPTGTGKTLSLFAFAAAHAKKWGKRRIIILLPFLALAEQNVREYRRVVPNLLESHSAAELSEDSRLLAERWSAECIVTTNVGFFEPLFASRPTDCRRLHQIANSVIVLDEAQSLPEALLDSTLRCVKELCDRYGCTAVFSTATQPSYRYRTGLAWNPIEIVPDPHALFSATRRVSCEWRIDAPTPLETIADELAAAPCGCAILNLRRHVKQLYELLCSRCDAQDVFFITTDLCLAHRREVLAEVMRRLDSGQPCRLVSSQCIEAGIDIDFPIMYRALAPLESIIQAAGRCNRNGIYTSGRLAVFVPDMPGRLYPDTHYQNAANCVKELLAAQLIDISNPEDIDAYYKRLYSFTPGDKESLRDAIKSRDFHAVAEEYRIIENSGVSVVVPYEPEAALFRKIRDAAGAEGLTPMLMKEARTLTVSSCELQQVRDICVPIPFRIPGGGMSNQTGWYLLGIPEMYDLKTGLSFDRHSFDGIT